MNMPSRERQLERIYARIPAIACQGKCQDSCGPLGMTQLERTRMVKECGRAPRVSLPTLTCNILDGAGRCAAYAARPAICRLWGVVADMPCVFGCVPERYLTDAEARQILREVEAIGGKKVFDKEIMRLAELARELS